jgi:thiamine-phosphate pyrophosphorylase
MLLYYITDRNQLPCPKSDSRRVLLSKIAEAAEAGVDYIQLREKDLLTRELESLVRDAVHIIGEANSYRHRTSFTRLLINSRPDVALATAANGVHLRSDDISPADVRLIASASTSKVRPFLVACSCHSLDEVRRAGKNGADLAVFAPVFEKKAPSSSTPAGLNALAEASRSSIPVLALGGVTMGNAADCVRAGAAGIAAIRLFQENPIAELVRHLRGGNPPSPFPPSSSRSDR